MVYKVLIAVCGLCLLVACDRDAEPTASQPGASRVADDHVFKEPVRALERAEETRRVLDAAQARQREALERQSR